VQAKSCVPVPEFELAEIKVDAAACGVPVHAVFTLSNAAKSKDLTGLKHTYQWYRTNKVCPLPDKDDNHREHQTTHASLMGQSSETSTYTI
jgi:hypothetical protein